MDRRRARLRRLDPEGRLLPDGIAGGPPLVRARGRSRAAPLSFRHRRRRPPRRTSTSPAKRYVIVQSGRRYWHNEAVLDRLAPLAPWVAIDVGGHAAVKVYRLQAHRGSGPVFPDR